MCESFYRIGKLRLYLHPKLKERCRSGRTGQSRKLLNSLWVPGVRIPLSPQKMKREKSCRVHSNNFFPSSSSAKPAAGGRGCATIGSKSPGESVIPSHPHVDVRPSGANPPERHIRTWTCYPREQTPSEGVTEIPVSSTLSEGVTRSLAVPVWNRCRCTGSTCRYHAQSACPVSSRHVQSAYPVSLVFCQKSYPLRHRFSSTLLFSYA